MGHAVDHGATDDATVPVDAGRIGQHGAGGGCRQVVQVAQAARLLPEEGAGAGVGGPLADDLPGLVDGAGHGGSLPAGQVAQVAGVRAGLPDHRMGAARDRGFAHDQTGGIGGMGRDPGQIAHGGARLDVEAAGPLQGVEPFGKGPGADRLRQEGIDAGKGPGPGGRVRTGRTGETGDGGRAGRRLRHGQGDRGHGGAGDGSSETEGKGQTMHALHILRTGSIFHNNPHM